jgi:hypothetical protein
LDSGVSTSTLTVGLGLVPLIVSPPSLPFGVGGLVRLSSRLYPDSQWMIGQVTAWTATTGSMSVQVTRYVGSGLGADWRITKLGFLDCEIDQTSIQAVSHAQQGPAGYFISDPASAAQVFDALANSAALWYGFNRAGQFGLGQLAAPTGAAALSLDESQILDLRRQASRPPVWSLLGRYQRNWAPFQLSQLAAQVLANAVINGRFDSDTTWSKGTGWSIGGGVASASPGTASDISQTLTLDMGQAYVLSGTVTVQAGSLQPKLDGVAIGGALTATGVVRHVFTATTAMPVLSFSKSADFMGTLDNVSVTIRDLSFMSDEWRWVTGTDHRAREIYGPSAIEETLTLHFDQQSDAQAEVSRQLTLLSSMRDVFEVIAKVQPFITDIGQVVRLTASRFGLKKGRPFVVLALDEDASANTIRLTLWG